MSAALLVRVLRDPASVTALDAPGWNGLIAAARAERLSGTLTFSQPSGGGTLVSISFRSAESDGELT